MRLSSIDTMQRCSSCISKWRHQFEGGDKNARLIRTQENVIIQTSLRNKPAAGCNMLKCWWNATLVFLIGRDAKQCKCLLVFSCKSFTYFRPQLYPWNALHVWCARRISNMPWRAQVWQKAVSSLPDSGLGYSLLSLKNSLFSSATEETLVSRSRAQLLQTRCGSGWRSLKSVLVTTKGAKCNATRPPLGWNTI